MASPKLVTSLAGTGRVNLLGQHIALGTLEEGAVLRNEDLAVSMHVSRTIVREAVRVLESLGMVTSRRRVGLIVTHRSRWNIYDPMIIRCLLGRDEPEVLLRSLAELACGIEAMAARLAAERATAAQRQTMTDAVMAMADHSRAGDAQACLMADLDLPERCSPHQTTR